MANNEKLENPCFKQCRFQQKDTLFRGLHLSKLQILPCLIQKSGYVTLLLSTV